MPVRRRRGESGAVAGWWDGLKVNPDSVVPGAGCTTSFSRADFGAARGGTRIGVRRGHVTLQMENEWGGKKTRSDR
jgi:hypothetical protein